MDFTLFVWRQKNSADRGRFAQYEARDVAPEMSFLEMLDRVNEELVLKGDDPIAFDHDCREGICGMCSQMINGVAHGPEALTTVCELYMRHFRDGDEIWVEPWRSKAFPVIRDLVVNRGALDRVIGAGGYVSVSTGSPPDGNVVPVPRDDLERAMDAAQCIGCGACVAACPNGSAMLFAAAKVAHLGRLPQGRVEAMRRVASMVAEMDSCGFGACSNHYECQAVCPKGIDVENISYMNREYLRSILKRPPDRSSQPQA